MKFSKLAIPAVLLASLTLPFESAIATPLSLNYSITAVNPSAFNYSFDLVLDNNDSSWQVGQSFNWIIFGDAQSSPTPLLNFVVAASSFPLGPFPNASTSSGYHNGPTFIDMQNFPAGGWTPATVGASLHWTGTASNSLGQGQLLFSNLLGSGDHASFAVANLVAAVPEPETYVLMLAGLGLMGTVARRRKAKQA